MYQIMFRVLQVRHHKDMSDLSLSSVDSILSNTTMAENITGKMTSSFFIPKMYIKVVCKMFCPSVRGKIIV